VTQGPPLPSIGTYKLINSPCIASLSVTRLRSGSGRRSGSMSKQRCKLNLVADQHCLNRISRRLVGARVHVSTRTSSGRHPLGTVAGWTPGFDAREWGDNTTLYTDERNGSALVRERVRACFCLCCMARWPVLLR
jgi:hypothetical protein